MCVCVWGGDVLSAVVQLHLRLKASHRQTEAHAPSTCHHKAGATCTALQGKLYSGAKPLQLPLVQPEMGRQGSASVSGNLTLKYCSAPTHKAKAFASFPPFHNPNQAPETYVLQDFILGLNLGHHFSQELGLFLTAIEKKIEPLSTQQDSLGRALEAATTPCLDPHYCPRPRHGWF